MVIEILNKIFLFLLILSGLNVLRIGYFFVQHWLDKEKFKLEKKTLFLLGLSIAYILLCIISGINL
jgi:hypothetical protein